MPADVFQSIKRRISRAIGEKTLYYPGCITLNCLPNMFNDYKALLSDIGIHFVIIDEFVCCGAPLLNAGYIADFEEIMKKNIEILKKNQISKIITNCPHCYDVFKSRYGLSVEHITQTLVAHKQKIVFKKKEEVSYHDPCLLARKHAIVDEPRILIRQTGLKLIEPAKNKEKTFCCGAGCGVKQNFPEIANKLAKERLKQLGSKKIITSCPYCYMHLQENCENKKSIVELSQALIDYNSAR